MEQKLIITEKKLNREEKLRSQKVVKEDVKERLNNESLRKISPIKVENLELNEAPNARQICVGPIMILSHDDDDSMSDLLKILNSISKNKMIMKYLNGEKKKLPNLVG